MISIHLQTQVNGGFSISYNMSRFYALSGVTKKSSPIVGGDPNSFFHSFRGAMKYLGEDFKTPLFLDDNCVTGIDSAIDGHLMKVLLRI